MAVSSMPVRTPVLLSGIALGGDAGIGTPIGPLVHVALYAMGYGKRVDPVEAIGLSGE